MAKSRERFGGVVAVEASQVYSAVRRGKPPRHVAVRRVAWGAGYPIAWLEEVTRAGKPLSKAADREWFPSNLHFNKSRDAWVLHPGYTLTELSAYNPTDRNPNKETDMSNKKPIPTPKSSSEGPKPPRKRAATKAAEPKRTKAAGKGGAGTKLSDDELRKVLADLHKKTPFESPSGAVSVLREAGYSAAEVRIRKVAKGVLKAA